jgi:CRISPR/Cas system-associated protein endoribonuclease Cas2
MKQNAVFVGTSVFRNEKKRRNHYNCVKRAQKKGRIRGLHVLYQMRKNLTLLLGQVKPTEKLNPILIFICPCIVI